METDHITFSPCFDKTSDTFDLLNFRPSFTQEKSSSSPIYNYNLKEEDARNDLLHPPSGQGFPIGSPCASSGSELLCCGLMDLSNEAPGNELAFSLNSMNRKYQEQKFPFAEEIDEESVTFNMPILSDLEEVSNIKKVASPAIMFENPEEKIPLYTTQAAATPNSSQTFMFSNINASSPYSQIRKSNSSTAYVSQSSPVLPSYDFPEIKGKYNVVEKIGEGTFSCVYKAHLIGKPDEFVALKRIHPTCSPNRILNEMQHLKLLGGHAHVLNILGGLRSQDQVSLLLPYFPHDKFKEYVTTMNLAQIKHYMRSLFESLEHLHRHGVIHRDIKPGNFLYNIKTNQFMLVDFGLAQMEKDVNPTPEPTIAPVSSSADPSPIKRRKENGSSTDPAKRRRLNSSMSSITEFKHLQQQQQQILRNLLAPMSESRTERKGRKNANVPRAGTRGFRAPEVLLKSMNQTVAVDIWSAGVIMLCILSMRYPFFLSPNDLTSLVEITTIFGTKEVKELGLSLNRKITLDVEMPKLDLKQLILRLSQPRNYVVPDTAFHLLERCLDLNPKTRITASEALKHPFFSEEEVIV